MARGETPTLIDVDSRRCYLENKTNEYMFPLCTRSTVQHEIIPQSCWDLTYSASPVAVSKLVDDLCRQVCKYHFLALSLGSYADGENLREELFKIRKKASGLIICSRNHLVDSFKNLVVSYELGKDEMEQIMRDMQWNKNTLGGEARVHKVLGHFVGWKNRSFWRKMVYLLSDTNFQTLFQFKVRGPLTLSQQDVPAKLFNSISYIEQFAKKYHTDCLKKTIKDSLYNKKRLVHNYKHFCWQIIKMCVNNHTHICHIMLYHFEKGWKAAQSFRDLNKLFSEGTISEILFLLLDGLCESQFIKTGITEENNDVFKAVDMTLCEKYCYEEERESWQQLEDEILELHNLDLNLHRDSVLGPLMDYLALCPNKKDIEDISTISIGEPWQPPDNSIFIYSKQGEEAEVRPKSNILCYTIAILTILFIGSGVLMGVIFVIVK
ncbi:uncharacterized protein LOC111625648 [Centruroides sculpturatus]|uniref:uncharacterized protein LOC111625648 n=1 Tax=Centruroides sculpturatus TaxID=218467 RepID=UPI000C6DF939|nr:uncharacterized protein LOC111625648 [Centruroides sculpturatus]